MVCIIIKLLQKHYSSKIFYASFMLTSDSAEELNQNYDGMSCVTGVTGTIGTTFGNAVEESKSEFNTKKTAAASGNLQDFMYAISHQPSKWEDVEHSHMTHDFQGNLELTWVSKRRIRIWGRFL